MPSGPTNLTATRYQVEHRLREQLEKSRMEFQNAAPGRRPAAREQYLHDLRAFSEYILTGTLPPAGKTA